MSLGIPQPRFMGPVEWMNSTAGLMSPYGSMPRVASEAQWRMWFTTAITLPALYGVNLPNPNQFSNWRSCAERFYAALDNKTAVLYQ